MVEISIVDADGEKVGHISDRGTYYIPRDRGEAPPFAFAPPPKGEPDPVADALDRMDFSPNHSVINTEWVQAQVDELRWLLGRSHPDD